MKQSLATLLIVTLSLFSLWKAPAQDGPPPPTVAQVPSTFKNGDMVARLKQGETLPTIVAEEPPPWSPSVESDGTLRLNLGHVMDVVEAIERLIPLMRENAANQQAAAAWTMPNLVWVNIGEGQVPTHLVMRNVTPLQAITLAVEAAGCHLQPIYAPEEEASAGAAGKVKPIIGYRIEQRTGAEQLPASSTRQSSQDRTAAERNPLQATPRVQPAPKLPAGPAGQVSGGVTLITPPPSPELFVRIYSLGAWLGTKPANVSEEEHRGHKLHGLKELISMALDRAGLAERGKGLDMVFHEETAALLVRATEAKHEIIRQTIEALDRPASK
ncbi:MAG: hypothetical protein HC841_01885 [Verrucomicrobiae bacterium]|nr:hypothetical protein [Verrucomicrobiae bacterium]